MLSYIRLNRGIFTVKPLYQTFFDISNNFRDIYREKQKTALYMRNDFTPFRIVFEPQLEISKFIYSLLPPPICVVLSKLEFLFTRFPYIFDSLVPKELIYGFGFIGKINFILMYFIITSRIWIL